MVNGDDSGLEAKRLGGAGMSVLQGVPIRAKDCSEVEWYEHCKSKSWS